MKRHDHCYYAVVFPMRSFLFLSFFLVLVGTIAGLTRIHLSEHVQLVAVGLTLLAFSAALRFGRRAKTT